jgi:serine/threonine protein kinase
MAPELVRGEVVDGRCDVYSLGVMGYEALWGAPPFSGCGALEIVAQHLTSTPRSIFEVAPGTPAWLGALVMCMLAKDPDTRPTVSEVLALLDRNVTSPEIVLELVADLPEDEAAMERDLEWLMDELSPRLALGSNP